MEKKRERSTNFTQAETRLLVDIAARFSRIIENKKTDSVTNREKEEAWTAIADQFNASNGGTYRSMKPLRLKYDNVKQTAKKKSAQNRQQVYLTGGGTAAITPFTDVEEKVLAISSNIGGLPARYDSDDVNVVLPGTSKQARVKVDVENQGYVYTVTDEVECVMIDTTTKNEKSSLEEEATILLVEPAYKQTPMTNKSSTDEETTILLGEPAYKQTPMTNKSSTDEETTILLGEPAYKQTPMTNKSSTDEETTILLGEPSHKQTPMTKWKTWNPMSLRTKKSDVLSARNEASQSMREMFGVRKELSVIQKEAANLDLQLKTEALEHQRLLFNLKMKQQQEAAEIDIVIKKEALEQQRLLAEVKLKRELKALELQEQALDLQRQEFLVKIENLKKN